MILRSFILAALLACLLAVHPVQAQCAFRENVDLRPSDPFFNTIHDVATDGDIVLLGAPRDHAPDLDAVFVWAGAGYVYRDEGDDVYRLQQRLVAPILDTGDLFGTAVGVDGDWIAISAPGDDDAALDAGAVYLYRWNEVIEAYELRQKILPQVLLAVESFGVALAMSGDQLLVASDSGRYRFYRRMGDRYALEDMDIEPVSTDPSTPDLSVSLHGDVAVIGNALRDRAFIHRYDPDDRSWPVEQILEGAPAFFGHSVTVHGDRMVIGAPLDNSHGLNSGNIYPYRFDGSRWVEARVEIPPTLGPDDRLGGTVAVRNDVLLVTRGADHGPDDPRRAVLVFREEDGIWKESRQLVEAPPDAVAYGADVTLNEKRAIVAAEGVIEGRLGSAWIYFDPNPRFGTVNRGGSNVVDVLEINGSTGVGPERRVEYDVLSPFEMKMRSPPSYRLPQRAPFALYLWIGDPGTDNPNTRDLPFDLGCTTLPVPLTGGTPQPDIIWNNARHFAKLGVPDRTSDPAPSTLVSRRRLTRVARFFVQGLIFDPASASRVPASVTNGILAVPVAR